MRAIHYAILVVAAHGLLTAGVAHAAVRLDCPGSPSEDCEADLDSAEGSVRASDCIDAAAKRQALANVFSERAEVRSALFDLPGAIADHLATARLLGGGERALNHWHKAAELAGACGRWAQVVLIGSELEKAMGKNHSGHAGFVVGEVLWQVQQAQARLGLAGEQAKTLQRLIDRPGPTPSARKFAAFAALARLKAGTGDRPGAERVWRQAVAAFERGGFAKDGGPEATVAAEAGFELLRPGFDASMGTKVVDKYTDATCKAALEEAHRLVKSLYVVLVGSEIKYRDPPKPSPTPPPRGGRRQHTVAGAFLPWCPKPHFLPERQGGLADAYADQVREQGAPRWTAAASLARAKMWKHIAKQYYVGDWRCASEDSDNPGEEYLDRFGGDMETKALADLEIALNTAMHADLGPPLLDDIYAELNKYKPREYPQLRAPQAFYTPLPTPRPADQTQALAAAVHTTPHDPLALLRYAADQAGRGLPPLARLALDAAAPFAEVDQLAQIAHLRAQLALAEGDLIAARNHLQQAVSLQPARADAWSDLGALWTRLRRASQAQMAAERAVALRPNSYEFRVNLGNAWRVGGQLQQAERARQAYLAAFAQAPDRPEAPLNLGIIYLENRLADLPNDEQRLQKSLDYFEAYLRLKGAAAGASDPVHAYAADAKKYLQQEETKRHNAERNAREREADLRRRAAEEQKRQQERNTQTPSPPGPQH